MLYCIATNFKLSFFNKSKRFDSIGIHIGSLTYIMLDHNKSLFIQAKSVINVTYLSLVTCEKRYLFIKIRIQIYRKRS